MFIEKLDRSTFDNSFLNDFRAADMKSKLEMLVLMANAVEILHKEGKGHFDIKPENFMIKDGETPIIKLIDFGMVSAPGVIRFCGTYHFMDPNMANPMFELDFPSDIYSLGMTIHELFYGLEELAMPDKSIADDQELFKQFALSRITIMDNLYRDFEEEYNSQGMEVYYINSIHNLIKSMVLYEMDKRPSIEAISELFNSLLEQLAPESIYLKKNQQTLFNKVYGGFIMPNIKDYSDGDKLEFNNLIIQSQSEIALQNSIANLKALLGTIPTTDQKKTII